MAKDTGNLTRIVDIVESSVDALTTFRSQKAKHLAGWWMTANGGRMPTQAIGHHGRAGEVEHHGLALLVMAFDLLDRTADCLACRGAYPGPEYADENVDVCKEPLIDHLLWPTCQLRRTVSIPTDRQQNDSPIASVDGIPSGDDIANDVTLCGHVARTGDHDFYYFRIVRHGGLFQEDSSMPEG